MYDTTSYPCFSLSSHEGMRLDLDQLAMGLICLQLSGLSMSLVLDFSSVAWLLEVSPVYHLQQASQ